MPILVPHADLAVVLGAERVASQARSVAELLEEVGRRVEPTVWKKATACTILLNGRNIHYLKGYSTSLETDDVVWMVVPAGGG